MADTYDWIGATGARYTYEVYPNPHNFNPNQFGNYIYAKKSSEGGWIPIYIGEGELAGRCCEQHHKATCIAAKGATHVHARRLQS
jgi:hypothetical protein